MEKEFLGLIPKRFLCPYCGKWHKWTEEDYYLGFFDSSRCQADFECSNVPCGYDKVNFRIYFYDGYLYYSTERMCRRANQAMNGSIPISSIVEDPDRPIVTFDVPFTSNSNVGKYECSDCCFKEQCNFVRLGDRGDNCHMTITFGFEFEQSDYNKFSRIAQIAQLARKERELQERENALNFKAQYCDEREQYLQERESALITRELEQQRQEEQSSQQEIKEETTMANNIFNLNMEFGPNKDENIASTLMGIAVKNGDSWRIYDKEKKVITDIGDMQLGNFPIFVLPTTKLSEGDLIRDGGEYFFVTKVATPETPTQTLSVRTGEMKSVVPIKNVLGFSCYSRVIALKDLLGDDVDVEKLFILSTMYGQAGDDANQMNQYLPLMLLKDKLGGDDDTMKLVLMSSMMNQKADSNQINPYLPLMFLKDQFSGDEDMMKLVLLSSMTGGNIADSCNWLTSYLMLDTFMSKKGSKTLQTVVDTPVEEENKISQPAVDDTAE